tara:strand:+ start:427 stop:1143 length:717 start_codon:yes stop_codon:yes gene_type:complete
MFKIINLYKLILILLLSFFITKTCFSGQKLTCATTNYPPYTIFDESTKTFSGLDIDIIAPLFKQLKIDVEIVNLPWIRLKKEIKKGSYDCYFSLGRFEDREEFLDYSNLPTHITTIAIFYPKHQKKIDFSNKIVGVHRGINIHENIPFSYGLKSSTIYKLPSNDVLFKMLKNGRVDAVITSKLVGEYISNRLDTNLSVEVVDIEEYKLPVYLAFKKDVIDINNINKVLLKIKNSIIQE